MASPTHEVYSKRLLERALGYPLWTPQLKTEICENYQLEGLKIGDVGIVSSNDGSFDVLFNITLERNQQPYPELVRENYTPVTLDKTRDLATQHDAVAAYGFISSSSVELASQEIHDRDQEPARLDYEFSLSMHDGALLILPEGAQSCDLANEGKFLDEAIQHGIEWYECATEKVGRFIGNDSFYLVTGFHKARSWSLGAAGQDHYKRQKQRSVKFRVDHIHQDSIPARAYLWMPTHGFTGRVGPTRPYEIPSYIRDEKLRRGVNQTVFVRGFRITVNRILYLKTVAVKTQRGTFPKFGTFIDNLLWGRPSESSLSNTGDPTDPTVDQDFSRNHNRLYMDTRMTINRVSDVPQAFHPGDLINQYMLRKEPRAMLALTHDNLWIGMLAMGLLDLEGFSREKRLEDVLSKNYRINFKEGAVHLEEGSTPHKHSEWTSPSVSRHKVMSNDMDDSASKDNSSSTPNVSSIDPAAHSYEGIQPTAASPVETKTIVVFGETGVGKSSLINLIAGRSVAPTSNDVGVCTSHHEKYALQIGNMPYTIWDTAGLGQGSFGGVPVKIAESDLEQLLRNLDIDLLIYCIRSSRPSETLLNNYHLFYSTIYRKKVPIVAAVTGLENYGNEMEDWWCVNEKELAKLNMHFDGHACVTTLNEDEVHPPALKQRCHASRQAVVSLVESACANGGREIKNNATSPADTRVMPKSTRNNNTKPIPIVALYDLRDHSFGPVGAVKNVSPFENGRLMDVGGSSFFVYRIHNQDLHSAIRFKKQTASREANLLIFCASVHSDANVSRQRLTIFYKSYGEERVPLLVIVKDASSNERAQEWWHALNRNGVQIIKDHGGKRLPTLVRAMPPPGLSKSGHKVAIAGLQRAIQTCPLRMVGVASSNPLGRLAGKGGTAKVDAGITPVTEDSLTSYGVWAPSHAQQQQRVGS